MFLVVHFFSCTIVLHDHTKCSCRIFNISLLSLSGSKSSKNILLLSLCLCDCSKPTVVLLCAMRIEIHHYLSTKLEIGLVLHCLSGTSTKAAIAMRYASNFIFISKAFCFVVTDQVLK